MAGTWISGKFVKNYNHEFPNSRRAGNTEIYYHSSTSCISGTVYGEGIKNFHLGLDCLSPNNESLTKKRLLSARWRAWTRADAYPPGLAIKD